ncbi:YbjN domain-containing protein [Aeromicrobium wangtongii]|uniref:YbjN domain-containing protein n=1 Tax=Aeromicrobium wangtongii TaxID=2969247 RepID=A0ABY5M3C7_9ACTN|nr:YbjN domain-containing protein [Aeromicrobium wangtongii]MCD9198320.1 YbjN domain-containing protein [Aeromicrobium wangtongii]UUP12352.1 YbjN domain-containing protein [Aeromicrobium wangtongii]
MCRRGHNVDIRLSSTRPIIEVWAVVAEGVDARRGRKLLDALNGSFHFYCFSLAGDSLIMSTTVNAEPFCPEHLDRAIESTYSYLEDEAPAVRDKLAAMKPKAAPDGLRPGLLVLYGRHHDRQGVIDLARSLTDDNPPVLRRWRHEALRASKRAHKKAAQTDHGPAQIALVEQHLAWRSVAAALGQVLDDETLTDFRASDPVA